MKQRYITTKEPSPLVNTVPTQIPIPGNTVRIQQLTYCFDSTFTNVKSFIAEVHTKSSNLAVNKDNIVDDFIFDDMYSPSP